MKIAIDCEWDVESKALRCATFYDGVRLYGSANTNKISKILESYKGVVGLCGHNISSDLGVLVYNGMDLPANFNIHDSLLAARLLDPTEATRELKPYARKYGLPYWEDEHDAGNIADLLEYCGKDCYATYVIEEELVKQMYKEQRAVYRHICQQELVFLAMECSGLKLDRKLLEAEKLRITGELSAYGGKLPTGIITNDNILREWLEQHYNEKELKFVPRTRKANKMGVSSDALKLLPRSTKLLESIITARSAYDYYSLYINRPLSLIDSNDYFNPAYSLLVAATHRRTVEPTVHNWPKEARKVVRSRFKNGLIYAFDYKNLEARLFAWQAGCKKFLQLLVEAGYPGVGVEVFGWKKVDKEQPEYKLLKSLVLAVCYNMGVGYFKMKTKIDQGLDLTWQEAEGYFDKFFGAFPELYDEQQKRIAYAREHKTAISSIVGCTIPLIGFNDAEMEQWEEKRLENKAINYPTQHLASYVTASALIDIYNYLLDRFNVSWSEILAYLTWTKKSAILHKSEKINVIPIIELHDALNFEFGAPNQEIEEDITAIMCAPPSLRSICSNFDYLLLDVEATKGESWQ